MSAIYMINGKPHELCKCDGMSSVCPKGAPRAMQTAGYQQCFVPCEGIVIPLDVPASFAPHPRNGETASETRQCSICLDSPPYDNCAGKECARIVTQAGETAIETPSAFYSEPSNCNGCGKPLVVENAWMFDGCPCNSPAGANDKNLYRWKLLSELQQKDARRAEKAERELGNLHSYVKGCQELTGEPRALLAVQINNLRDKLATARADEREMCARVCEEISTNRSHRMATTHDGRVNWNHAAIECADSIRASAGRAE